MCVLVMFEREELYCKSQIQLLCAPSLLPSKGKCGTAPKQNLTERSFFEISTSNLKLV